MRAAFSFHTRWEVAAEADAVQQVLVDLEHYPEWWPEVVAVVPARNEADVIARSLGSLIAQDYPGVFRILLVDDDSEDGTGAIARMLPGDRLTVIDGKSLKASLYGGCDLKRDIPLFVDLWRAGKLDIDSLITRRIGFEDLNGAVRALTDGEVIRQVVLFD